MLHVASMYIYFFFLFVKRNVCSSVFPKLKKKTAKRTPVAAHLYTSYIGLCKFLSVNQILAKNKDVRWKKSTMIRKWRWILKRVYCSAAGSDYGLATPVRDSRLSEAATSSCRFIRHRTRSDARLIVYGRFRSVSLPESRFARACQISPRDEKSRVNLFWRRNSARRDIRSRATESEKQNTQLPRAFP